MPPQLITGHEPVHAYLALEPSQKSHLPAGEGWEPALPRKGEGEAPIEEPLFARVNGWSLSAFRMEATEGCSSGRSMPAHTTPGSLEVPGPNYSSPYGVRPINRSGCSATLQIRLAPDPAYRNGIRNNGRY